MPLPTLPIRPQRPVYPLNSNLVRAKVGLDVGTTFTAGVLVGQRHSTKRLDSGVIIPFKRYKDSLGIGKKGSNSEQPTCIRYDDGHISIGDEAETREDCNWNPLSKTIRRMKLGLDEQMEFDEPRKHFLATLAADMTTDSVMEDFLTEIFRSWRREMADLGFPDTAIIDLNCAVPAAWTTTRPLHRLSKIILNAGKVSELNIDPVIRFWPEPIAAAANMIHENSNFRNNMKV